MGGAPGDAFTLVYSVVTDAVREKVHAVDPVLAEYIRCACRRLLCHPGCHCPAVLPHCLLQAPCLPIKVTFLDRCQVEASTCGTASQ